MGRGEARETRELIEAAVRILEDEWPMTIRQLYYRLVSIEMVVNNQKGYRKVSRVMTMARKDGRCDYDFIVDRSRPEYTVGAFRDPKHFLRVLTRGYRKDYWQLQPNHVEIFLEKDAAVGSIEDLCNELGVSIYPSKGFNSTTKVHETAVRLGEIRKPIKGFYLGDHDPSGCNPNTGIEADLKRRILDEAKAMDSYPEFELTRLAIFKSDIARFKLPPFRAKETDTRAEGFVRKFGRNCVELDALPPNELRRRIKRAVEAEMDREAWDRAVAVEEVEKQSIQDFVAAWPKPAA